MSNKVRVYSNDNVAIVGSMQNYLLQHEIQAEIRNQYTSGVMGEAAFFDAWPELWVFAQDVERASALLEAVTVQSDDSKVDWLCSNCKEENPGSFEICWHCSQADSA